MVRQDEFCTCEIEKIISIQICLSSKRLARDYRNASESQGKQVLRVNKDASVLYENDPGVNS